MTGAPISVCPLEPVLLEIRLRPQGWPSRQALIDDGHQGQWSASYLMGCALKALMNPLNMKILRAPAGVPP